MRILSCNTVVVGAGAAGLNAADELSRAGVDVLLLADSFEGGTSRNAGSDKQTYYKLSLSGAYPESVTQLARSFYAGGGMHGDHAYAMAALSSRSFMKLNLLGVPFPHNEWGEFVGYQTDHDLSQRATSAGPLTSRMMAEALMKSVQARGVRMADGLQLISVLTGEGGRARGLMMLNLKNPADPFVLVNARFVVLCTGGPAMIYRRTVFPDAQMGATGAALRAGAAASNLCYWQYGLASVKVKWNVSGSYQQALPAYTDGHGEFLPPHFAGRGDMMDSVFLKGYQWPFDARKLAGSSRVDMAVQALNKSGARAYMDFTREPLGDAFEGLGAEATDYLKNCGASGRLPIDRLRAINQKAIDFYASHGIDLSREPLQVAVCAQHSNGGLKVDRWWRTTVDGLYAAGECAGAFGVYRPGGSALNETQVGSLRAAQHIAAHGGQLPPLSEPEFMGAIGACVQGELEYFNNLGGDDGAAERQLAQLRCAMDDCAGVIRSTGEMKSLLSRLESLLSYKNPAADVATAALLRDVMAVQRAALSAMICQSQYSGDAGHGFVQREPVEGAPEANSFAFETTGGVTRAVSLRPLPEGDGWFEAVWRRYLDGTVFD